MRSVVKESHGADADIELALNSLWSIHADEDKARYQVKVDDDKARYQREMGNYSREMENWRPEEAKAAAGKAKKKKAKSVSPWRSLLTKRCAQHAGV